MITTIGDALYLFGSPPDWHELLFGRGRLEPNKLLSAALYPYMMALYQCIKKGSVSLPIGDVVSIVEGFDGEKVNLAEITLSTGVNFTIRSYSEGDSAKIERVGSLYLPLQRAGLVEYIGPDDWSGGVFIPTEQGIDLLNQLGLNQLEGKCYSPPYRWDKLLFGEGKQDPDKLVNVALFPYIAALRDCTKKGLVKLTTGIEVIVHPDWEKHGLTLNAPYDEERIEGIEAIASLYFPLTSAQFVKFTGPPYRNGCVFRPTGKGEHLIMRLDITGYFNSLDSCK